MKDEPLISIITVCLNSEKTIEKTILSVLEQTYKNIEYIIIDGGSTDGTLKIIEKYKDKIAHLISEKDKGIYDAMNKGTSLAKGEYLNFMNSDDYFFNKKTIEKVIPYLNGENDVVYGNTQLRYKKYKFNMISPSPKFLWTGPLIHQSSFIKREIMNKYKYNIENKYVADFEFFLNVLYNGEKIIKINKIISSYSIEGTSGRNRNQVLTDHYNTLKKYRNDIPMKIHHNIMRGTYAFLDAIKKFTSREI